VKIEPKVKIIEDEIEDAMDRIIAKRFFEIRIQHYARRIANERQKKRTGSERGSKTTEDYCHTRNIS
jgi:hypothetical protein